jgi:hypothetical protein
VTAMAEEILSKASLEKVFKRKLVTYVANISIQKMETAHDAQVAPQGVGGKYCSGVHGVLGADHLGQRRYAIPH